MTKTSTFDLHVSDLGTVEIHLRHSVMIEGGPVPRSRVMDQTVIDRLLIDGLIDKYQFAAAEYFLNQAASASVFVKSIDFMSFGRSSKKPDHYCGIIPYAKTMKLVANSLTNQHAQVLHGVVCEDMKIGDDEILLEALRDALDVIARRRLSTR